MADEIRPGDVVRLKSGGPKMTATSIGDNWGQMSVWCEWFDEKNKADKGVFALTSVEKAEAGTSSRSPGAKGPRVV